MYCKLKDKEVQIIPAKEVKNGRGEIVHTFYECSGCYVENFGVKMRKMCNMANNKECLLNQMR